MKKISLLIILLMLVILPLGCKKEAEDSAVKENTSTSKPVESNDNATKDSTTQDNITNDNNTSDNQVVEKLYKPKNRYELKELLKDETIKLDTIDVSLIKNLSYIFKGTNRKDFNGIESWNVPQTVLQYNTFKGTPIEKNPPSWYYDNPPKILYTPEDKYELEELLDNSEESPYLGNIDVSKITDLSDINLLELDGIEYWDVSNVENMDGFTLSNDNVEIGHWDVSKVKNMNSLFRDNNNFNDTIEMAYSCDNHILDHIDSSLKAPYVCYKKEGNNFKVSNTNLDNNTLQITDATLKDILYRYSDKFCEIKEDLGFIGIDGISLDVRVNNGYDFHDFDVSYENIKKVIDYYLPQLDSVKKYK